MTHIQLHTVSSSALSPCTAAHAPRPPEPDRRGTAKAVSVFCGRWRWRRWLAVAMAAETMAEVAVAQMVEDTVPAEASAAVTRLVAMPRRAPRLSTADLLRTRRERSATAPNGRGRRAARSGGLFCIAVHASRPLGDPGTAARRCRGGLPRLPRLPKLPRLGKLFLPATPNFAEAGILLSVGKHAQQPLPPAQALA